MLKASIVVLLIISILHVDAQPTAKLPTMSDWFLSSGDWNSDPQLYVREFGTGKDTVIMLHGGWGGDYEGLLDAVRALAGEFHFIFYDQRGSLRSPFPDASISYDAHVGDLERLRKELKLNKFRLVGHSMGGVLACAYATKYPQRIKSLVLLAPASLKNPLPVSIITGDHDFIDFGNVLVRKWTTGKKGYTFTPIKNAGHVLWIDQPDVFTRELRKELKKN